VLQRQQEKRNYEKKKESIRTMMIYSKLSQQLGKNFLTRIGHIGMKRLATIRFGLFRRKPLTKARGISQNVGLRNIQELRNVPCQRF